MKNLWKKISLLGLKEPKSDWDPDYKRIIFFNQVLFIGIFATMFQVGFVWPFIGMQALVFLIVCMALKVALYLNYKQQFQWSKRLYVIIIYAMGILTTLLLGGAALYHVQVLLIFTSCLILFDFRKEKIEILAGIPVMVLCILIGEYNLLGAPDFSQHYFTPVARVANICSLIFISTILVLFITRLNAKNEEDLSLALKALTSKTRELERNKIELEDIVQERTSKLSMQNEILERQNEEKIILLKEVHHRVRNNLQIISSLINLQKKKNDNATIQNALQEIQGRVESMSLVHQKMYQTSNFKKIGLNGYILNIIENIGDLYGVKDDQFTLDIPGEIHLKMDTAIPIGLVVNEVIANYYKHVFALQEESHFEIKVSLRDSDLKIGYWDDGPGFQDGFDIKETSSLGCQLIDNLLEQMEGSYNYGNKNGAYYIFEIPLL